MRFHRALNCTNSVILYDHDSSELGVKGTRLREEFLTELLTRRSDVIVSERDMNIMNELFINNLLVGSYFAAMGLLFPNKNKKGGMRSGSLLDGESI